ncbi:hypothetical protein J2Y69_003085 [Microbacterium resistens]|uniref:Uncharacterized protein n=1 Tax=Microbacterium resistens TaxID=156977 RepID=A0ABU1SFT5_9MICO|nr:hypothetical protein [Microbacterium resistens]MDR6868469.1 hypothetical protein [Microbacterium resistens]
MMLAEKLADPPSPPEILGSADVGPDGGELRDVKADKPISDWSDVLRRFNLDPDVFEVDRDTVRMSTWQQSKRTDTGDRDVVQLYSYRASFRRKRSMLDLPTLYAAAKARRAPDLAPADNDRTMIVVLSDVQAGKTGSRGGTPELLERLQGVMARLEKRLRARRPSRIVLAEGGDLFENFHSGGDPAFTNDLSLAQQMDLAGTIVFDFVRLLSRFAPVDVLTVTSNHTAWRNGPQTLGKPADDLGLYVHRQVEKLAAASRLRATWHFPGDYDESIAFDAGGTVLGMVHGNQYGPGRAIDWWTKQQHGAQPVARADVLIGAHYHHLMVQPTGRNARTGRAKWFLQAPTLDNGSDWYRNKAGDDSDPGLLTFDVTGNGFDLQSLTVL